MSYTVCKSKVFNHIYTRSIVFKLKCNYAEVQGKVFHLKKDFLKPSDENRLTQASLQATKLVFILKEQVS